MAALVMHEITGASLEDPPTKSRSLYYDVQRRRWYSGRRRTTSNGRRFNGKIEQGVPFLWVPVEGILCGRMVMTLPTVLSTFSHRQCVVGHRLKGTRAVPSKRGESADSFRAFPELADSADGTSCEMDYHIETITKDDELRVLKFLRRFFFRDEPLNHSIKLIPEGEDSTCLELEKYCCVSSFENNLSLMTVSSNGAIIGVLLNAEMEPYGIEEPDYIENCKNPKFKKILRLLRYVDKTVNGNGQFKGQRVMEIRIISVDSNWRGKGVAKGLIEKSIEIARERGFQAIRADCSSLFSGKLCARFGFEAIYELNYKDYVDEDGNPIFSPASPHKAMVTYVKRL